MSMDLCYALSIPWSLQEPPELRIANFQHVLTSCTCKVQCFHREKLRIPGQCFCLFLFPGWGFSMGTKYHFHSWRVFVLVCALPCIASLVALKFMPESPRFLLEVRWFISNLAVWFSSGWQVPNVSLPVFLCPVKHTEHQLRDKTTASRLYQLHRLPKPQRLQAVGSITDD